MPLLPLPLCRLLLPSRPSLPRAPHWPSIYRRPRRVSVHVATSFDGRSPHPHRHHRHHRWMRRHRMRVACSPMTPTAAACAVCCTNRFCCPTRRKRLPSASSSSAATHQERSRALPPLLATWDPTRRVTRASSCNPTPMAPHRLASRATCPAAGDALLRP